MNNNQTVEKLKGMRLSAMAELHLQHVKNNRLNELSPDEYLALLADHEWEDSGRRAGKTRKLNAYFTRLVFARKPLLQR